MGPRRTRSSHPSEAMNELANANRNTRQKTVLLCELNVIRRGQAQAAIEESKRTLAHSKQLCQKSAPAKRSKSA